MRTTAKPASEATATKPTIEAFGVPYDLDVIVARIRGELDTQAEEMHRIAGDDGRRWAAEAAYFQELSALEELRGERVSFYQLCKQFDGLEDFVALEEEDATAIRVSEKLACAFGSGFVAGAIEVWDLVRPRIGGSS